MMLYHRFRYHDIENVISKRFSAYNLLKNADAKSLLRRVIHRVHGLLAGMQEFRNVYYYNRIIYENNINII